MHISFLFESLAGIRGLLLVANLLGTQFLFSLFLSNKENVDSRREADTHKQSGVRS